MLVAALRVSRIHSQTFAPETAVRWLSPAARNCSPTSCDYALPSPITNPGNDPAESPVSACAEFCCNVVHTKPAPRYAEEDAIVSGPDAANIATLRSPL